MSLAGRPSVRARDDILGAQLAYDRLLGRKPRSIGVIIRIARRVHRWRFLTGGRRAELVLLLDEVRLEVEGLEARAGGRASALERLQEVVGECIDVWDDCGRPHLRGAPLVEDECGPMCALMLAYAPFVEKR